MTTTDDKTTDQTEDQGPDTPDAAPETPSTAQETAGQGADSVTVTQAPEAAEPTEDADTFPRAYVEDLRRESAGYRTQVRDLQEQLHRVRVEQAGALADPADLPFDPAHLESPEALQAAIDTLLEAKPHLKARRFAPDAAAQGPKGTAPGAVDLLGILRSRA